MKRAHTPLRFRISGNTRRIEPLQLVAAVLNHCFHLNRLNSGNSLTLQCSKQLTLRYRLRFRRELLFVFKLTRFCDTALQTGYVSAEATA